MSLLGDHQQQLNGGTHSSNLKVFLSGGIAGIISSSIAYPFYFSRYLTTTSSASTKSNIQQIQQLVKKNGLPSIFRGNVKNSFGVFPFQGAQFLCFHRLSNIFKGESVHTTTFLQKQLIGGVSGIVGTILVHPLDIMRQRINLTKVNFNPKNQGIRGLYSGILPRFIRIYPFSAINYSLYETFKENSSIFSSFFTRLFVASFIGGLSTTVIYPLQQVNDFTNFIQELKTIYKINGTLFKGLSRILPASMIQVGVLYSTNDLLQDTFS